MRRVPRIRQQQLLQAASKPNPQATHLPKSVARTITTSVARPDKWSTDRWRQALWKGKPPGPEDPYAEASSQKKQRQLLEDQTLAEYEAEQAELAAETFDAPDVLPARLSKPKTRLIVKHERTWAPREVQLQSGEYIPATDAEGLEEVGGLHDWWEREGHWGKESEYVGFAPGQKFTDAAVCEVLVRQAVIEVLAFRSQGQEDKLTAKWVAGDRAGLEKALATGLKISEDGSVSLGGDASALVENLFRTPEPAAAVASEEPTEAVAEEASDVAIADPVETSDAAILSPEEARELLQSWDASWKEISLQDVRLKFALSKRIFQLTGHLIPDAKLARVESVRHLLSVVVKPPKPTKLIDVLEGQGDLVTLPNVTVYNRRITPIDKEMWVGRWKVIEQELKKRSLPVTGHEKLTRPKERDWIRGRT